MLALTITDGYLEILLNGQGVGTRWACSQDAGQEALDAIKSIGADYHTLLASSNTPDQYQIGLRDLGVRLGEWIDRGTGDFVRALAQAQSPITFEVRGPVRPSPDEWAVINAPWELLVIEGNLLAADHTMGFAPYRRLGQATEPPALDDYRLGIAFMASSPRGATELDFEAEESAILSAVNEQRVDLLVEDSGESERLGATIGSLADHDRPPVLHISCHGMVPNDGMVPDEGEPLLALETSEGDIAATPASLLRTHLNPRVYQPHLLFLSACHSSEAPSDKPAPPPALGEEHPESEPSPDQRAAHSLAASLALSGFPAVLGWGGSVYDTAATAFAKELYKLLAQGTPLTEAVAEARIALLASNHPTARHWHLARLLVGATGGGPVIQSGASRKRSILPRGHGARRVNLMGDPDKPEVPGPEMFVGRRKELKTTLRTLREPHNRGVLLHGMGRLGKTTLASRIADRRADLAFGVVYKDYSAIGLLAAIRKAIQLKGETPGKAHAFDILDRGLKAVRADPEALEDTLVSLLQGPCEDKADGCALLLLIDDFEQVLTEDAALDTQRVLPHHAGVMRALLRAFADSTGDSRLLVTSRYTFYLPGGGVDGSRDLASVLSPIQLAPFGEGARHKLKDRQFNETAEGMDKPEVDARLSLLNDADTLAHGNPGLQDLLGRKIAMNPAVELARARVLLGEVEAYLEGGAEPTSNETTKFIESIAIKNLLALAREEGHEHLRRLTVFQMPVPAPAVDAVGTVGEGAPTGASRERLVGLGLLDPFEDIVDHRVTAYGPNRLVRGLLADLTDEETREAARVGVSPLFEAWGGAAGREERPYAADIFLTTLALQGGATSVLLACAPDAVRGLGREHAPGAATLGEAVLEALVQANAAPPLRLFAWVAQAARTAGDGARAGALMEQVYAALEAPGFDPPAGDPDVTAALGELAEQQHRAGDLEGALATLERRVEHVRENEHSVAFTRGKIADILQARGQLDEALTIRREQQLPVLEKLGDVREVAVARGKIADILHARGQLDEASTIRGEQELPVYEKLGDVRSVAITRGKIADILHARGQLDEALAIRREQELPVYEKLGDVREVAVARGRIADMLQARGQLDEALTIRREQELPVYEKLGDVREVALTRGKIADILQARGQLDEALTIRGEQELPVYEKLGDVREVATARGKIADILWEKGQHDEALAVRQRVIEDFRALGLAQPLSSALWNLAVLYLEQNEVHHAAPLIAEAYSIVVRLGQADGIVAIGPVYAQFAAGAGQLDAAKQAIEITRDAAVTLKEDNLVDHLDALAAKILKPETEQP